MISLVTAGHTTLVPDIGAIDVADGAAVMLGVAELVAVGVALLVGLTLVDAVGVGVAAGSVVSAALAVAAMNPVVARVKATAAMAARLRLLSFVLLMLTT